MRKRGKVVSTDSIYRTHQIDTLALLLGLTALPSASTVPVVTQPHFCCHCTPHHHHHTADSSLLWRLLPGPFVAHIFAATIPKPCHPPFTSGSKGLPDATEAGDVSGLTVICAHAAQKSGDIDASWRNLGSKGVGSHR